MATLSPVSTRKSVTEKLRETVSQSRDDPPPVARSASNDESEIPAGGDASTAQSSASVDAARQKGLAEVMDFVAKMTTASARDPAAPVDALLDSLGYTRGTGDSSDDEDDRLSSNWASSNFSFSSASGGSSGIFVALNRSAGLLTGFSSTFAHRCYIENQPLMLSREQQEARAAGYKPAKAERQEMARTMVPWRGQAAVAFVDLSGYSSITAALTEKGGAHALSAAVNLYFETLLSIIEQFSGDVLSFAGDAIAVIWPCSSVRTSKQVCLAACACALELQRRAGRSRVEGTDLEFGLHIATTFGEVDSQILKTTAHQNNQQAYHFLSGKPLRQTRLLDFAARGEIVVSAEVHAAASNILRCRVVAGASGFSIDVPKNSPYEVRSPSTNGNLATGSVAEVANRVYLLTGIDDEYEDVLRNQSADLTILRSPWLEQALAPGSVVSKLRQGFKPQHIAEIRLLAVLFIRKNVDQVATAAWFEEVHQVLDECRAPIVQCIEDDKSVHLIAAVSLYHTEAYPATVAIRAARRLALERKTGSVIGVACGEVYCGITGATDTGFASRWDITGPAVVRAARLMQYGVTIGSDVVFDRSIAESTEDASQLDPLKDPIILKGSLEPVHVYTLTEESVSVTAGLLNIKWASPTLHIDKRRRLVNEFLTKPFQRGFALLSGPVGAGRKTLITLELQMRRIPNIFHFSTRDKTPLNLVRTIVDWCSHHMCPILADLGGRARESLVAGHLTQTLSLTHQAINRLISMNETLCVVVAYIHLLDRASIDFIKAIIATAPTPGEGRFLVIATAYPLWGHPLPRDLEAEFFRPLSENESIKLVIESESGADVAAKVQTGADMLHIEVQYGNVAEFADAFRGSAYWLLRDDAAEIVREATGGCLSLIEPLIETMRNRFLDKSSADASEQLLPATIDGTIHCTSKGRDYLLHDMDWKRVAPHATSRMTELYDALPPRLQLVLRVFACFYPVSGAVPDRHIAGVLEKLNPRITLEKTRSDIKLLCEQGILRVPDKDDGGEFKFLCPAMLHCVAALLTPDQTKIIFRYGVKRAVARVDSEEAKKVNITFFPIFVSYTARMSRAAGDIETYHRLMKLAYSATLEATANGEHLELRARMEDRLAEDAFRYPEVMNHAVFEEFSEKPSLVREESAADKEFLSLEMMPSELIWCTVFMPPCALGPISGELQKVVWDICNKWLDLTKRPGDVFMDPNTRDEVLRIDFDNLFEAIAKLEKILPPIDTDGELPSVPDLEHEMKLLPKPGECTIFDTFEPPATLDDERALLERLISRPRDLDEAYKFVRIYRAYHYKCTLPRRNRAVAMQMRLTSPESLNNCQMLEKADNTSPLWKAYNRLVLPEVPLVAMHHSILDLAVSGWGTKYFHINLQTLRDQLLRSRIITVFDYKAFLVSQMFFGDCLTPKWLEGSFES